MRTTIDLPDDIFRRAKADAALRGMKFKEYATALFRQGLPGSPSEVARTGHLGPLPVSIPGAGRKFTSMSNAELLDIVDQEDDLDKDRLVE